MNGIPSIEEQARRSLEEIEHFKKGKLTFKSNKFELSSDSLDSKNVKLIREDILHASQKVLAESIEVSVRTVQVGKSVNQNLLVLLESYFYFNS